MLSFKLRSRRWLVCALACALPLLAGCDGFFDKSADDGGDDGTGSGNYLYVANVGSTSVSGYQISTSGVLTAVKNSPYTVPDTPTSVTVTRNNKYLYVGTATGIYGYSIGSAGQLTKIASGSVLQLTNAASMDTSPDGKWLIVLGTAILDTSKSTSVTAYTIGSDGTIAVNNSSSPYIPASGAAREVHITPNASFIYATMGTDGTLVYQFNTSNGVVTYSGKLDPLNSSTSDSSFAIAPDNSRLYLARSGTTAGLTQYNINSSTGAITQSGSTYATGQQPYSVVMDNAGKYVYVANRTDSTISGYVVGSAGALTVAPQSPYSAGNAITALGADSTGKWILGVAYSSTPDITLYGFDSDSTKAGRIYSVGSANAGTNPSYLALTHK